ncbi:Popeye domain-containing protein 2, partial [Armadillidium nasatum]
VRVTCDSTYLHCIFPNQFLDSAEWESAENGNVDNLFQVSLIAEERSQYMTWSRPALKQLLATRPFLKAVKTLTTKLYSLNEYKPEGGKENELPKVSDLLNEKLLQRSRSADNVHMGSKGYIRSDVWMSHKIDADLRSAGGLA